MASSHSPLCLSWSGWTHFEGWRTARFRTIQVYPKDLRVLPVHPEPAVSWHGGFRGGAHARPKATPVHHAVRRCGHWMAVSGVRAARGRGSTGNAMKGIAEWLASIGLSEYAQRFADNAIDLSVLRDLTEQDLKDLGVLLGHRRKILRAIAELDGVAPAPIETATEPVARDEAERRHLTVMICDLVGSTALSARLDPEDMNAVIDAYHAACARIMLTYDGFIGEFRGDGILAYFGYPRAHEDDADRTVRAGLDIIAAVAHLETPAGEPLAVRIG